MSSIELMEGPSAGTSGRVRRAGQLSRVIGVALVVGGMMVVAGWALQVETIKTLIPQRVATNPVSAICFVLLGMSLWLGRPAGSSARDWSVHPRIKAVAVFCSLAAVMLGLLAIVSDMADWRFRVDRLLFRYRLGTNQMAPNTAVSFMLLGTAQAMMALRRASRHRIAPLLALAAGALALLALTGYLYGVGSFYRVRTFIPMAVNTAVGFLLASVGVLAGGADREPLTTLLSDTLGGVVARRLLPCALLIPLALGWICLKGERLGLYEYAYGVSLFTLGTIAVFVVLTWWITRFLHRLDVERRRSEQKLRQAEAVYQSLVETLPQNIFRKNREGRFTFGNRNFCAELGLPLDRIVGKTDLDFFSPTLAERYRRDDQAVIDTGITLDTVEQHITPSGAKLYVQVMKTPVTGLDGKVIGVQGIFWDVTDRKLAEEELERKNEMLEEANRMLKESVTSERQALEALKKAQGQLIQSEKLVGLGQMVAGVAHEINNPLAFVSNNVVVLQRDMQTVLDVLALYREGEPAMSAARPELGQRLHELDGRVDLKYTLDNLQDLLARSRDGLKRIQQIVKDLRDFARLDESDLHEVDINEGIESTLNIIRGHAKKKRIVFDKALGQLPLVMCFPAKVNQVVMNLAVNAIDASPEGGHVTIRTGAGRSEPDADGNGISGPVVRIEVKDQGTGIDPAIVKRIFDPFTTKPPGQGTGLGLSISYGIVRDHGGTIDVESTPGAGSTFRVTLPVGKADERVSG